MLPDDLYLSSPKSFQKYAKQMLDIGHAFIDLEDRDDQGRTILLQYLSSECLEFPGRSIVRLLFAKGADLQARDSQGNSCLHLCIGSFWDSCSAPSNRLMTLLTLIQGGADVFARNSNGESVSDVASNCKLLIENCSYWEDLWAAALVKCGFNPANFFEEYPIKARYSNYYTPSDREFIMQNARIKVPNPRGKAQSPDRSAGETYQTTHFVEDERACRNIKKPDASGEDEFNATPTESPSPPLYVGDMTLAADRAEELHWVSQRGGDFSPHHDITGDIASSSWITDDTALLEENPWS